MLIIYFKNKLLLNLLVKNQKKYLYSLLLNYLNLLS